MLLIETVTKEGTEWGVGLTNNLEDKDYIACKTKKDAEKLLDRLTIKHCPHEELKNAAQPLVDILYKYYNPHTIITVEMGHVEVLCGNMAAPFEVRD